MTPDSAPAADQAARTLDVESATAALAPSVAEPLLAVQDALQAELAGWRAASTALNRRMSDAQARASAELADRVDRGPRARLTAVLALLAELDTGPGTAVDRIARAERLAVRADLGLAAFATGTFSGVASSSELRSAIEEIGRSLECGVRVRVDDAHAPATALAAAYFVCAEALTNMAKHARARHATVDVTVEATQVVVQVVDDGTGGADPDGPGLDGLARRIVSIGGSFAVESSAGSGTTIRATVPR